MSLSDLLLVVGVTWLAIALVACAMGPAMAEGALAGEYSLLPFFVTIKIAATWPLWIVLLAVAAVLEVETSSGWFSEDTVGKIVGATLALGLLGAVGYDVLKGYWKRVGSLSFHMCREATMGDTDRLLLVNGQKPFFTQSRSALRNALQRIKDGWSAD